MKITPTFTFDASKCVVFDVECYLDRWVVGFHGPNPSGQLCFFAVDGNRDDLDRTLQAIVNRGLTLVGYNSRNYDIPMMRAILAGVDPYEVSQLIVHNSGRGLPDGLWDRLRQWPDVRADHIDLSARTKRMGRFPSLKTVAANLGLPRLQELPFDPERPLTDAQWEEVKTYNLLDLEVTRHVLDHFAAELQAIAALSERFGRDLRSIHQAGIAQRILCDAYRQRHGGDPERIDTPETLKYVPPDVVQRPQNPTAAAWYDRLIADDFPMVPGKGESAPKPEVPEPPSRIDIGGVEISVGQGGIHSLDKPQIYRSDDEYTLIEADVSSYYPALMVAFGISPRSLGECGRELFREILDTRLELKKRAGEAVEPTEAKQLKIQADGLKIVLNSTFGQFGNHHSPLYDPEALLAVTLTGQLLLIHLLEQIDECTLGIVSANTDGIVFKVRRLDCAWKGVLENWQAETGMVLEVTELETLAVAATNSYATVTAAGKVKRKGTLGDALDWAHVPSFRIVADAVTFALLRGTLPEQTVGLCRDPLKFTTTVRRDRRMDGVLIDEATGTEEPIGRLARFYKGRGSKLRIEHRWATDDGRTHKTTPSNATDIRLLMDLPEDLPDDLDRHWYIGEARRQILTHPGFPHLDPKWLGEHAIAKELYGRGLSPAPKWAGKNLPPGAKVDRPSFFWAWDAYQAFGTWTGAEVGILALDIDEPDRFRSWIDADNEPLFNDRWRALDAALVSYHRNGSSDGVRTGRERGKLLFRFTSGPDHPLVKMAIGHWKKTRGFEIFFGRGTPTVLGKHPDGPEHDYLLDGVLGEPPAWLIEGLTPKTKPLQRRRTAGSATNGHAVLDEAIARVAATSEGNGLRNSALFTASLSIGELVAAGTLERTEAEEKLVEASTLAPDEAQAVVERAFAYKAAGKGAACACRDESDGTDGIKPTVEVNTELDRVRDEILDLLRRDPDLFRRGNILVRLVQIKSPTHKLRGGVELRNTVGLYAIVPIDEATFQCRLTTLANFVRWEKKKDGEEIAVPINPPKVPVQAVLNNIAYPGVRTIEGVVEVPYFRKDGTLCPPGYDDETGIVYIPTVEFETLLDAPTQQDARAAAERLLRLVSQFPFSSDEDRAVWLAAVLELVARPMINGPVPGKAFIGNRAGIGKGKLVNGAGLIALGRTVPTTMYPVSREETIKTKVALALAAPTTVFFDNLEDGSTYGNGTLDSSITEMILNERVLGMSKTTGEIELRPCWFLSGNNLSPAKDAYRRWLVCNLKSRLENPEERDDIEIADLPAHILAHRGELLRDVLTILKAHSLAGRPTGKWAPLGSFEKWDPIIRGAVWFATGWDCNRSRKAAAAEAPERLKKLALLDAWEATSDGGEKGNGITVRTAHTRALTTDGHEKLTHPDLHEAFMGFSKDGKFPSPDTVGKAIGSMNEVMLDGKMFTKVGKAKNAVIWKVVRPCW